MAWQAIPQLIIKAAPHIPKAKKCLTLLNKVRRTVTKSRTAATKGRELLRLGQSKPFPNTLVNATQRNKLLQTQRNNLMLRGGENISKLPWWHPKKLLWEKALFDVATGEDPINSNLKNRRLKIEKEKILRQEENEIAAAQIQMDGDNQLAIQEAEGARIAKERLKRLKLEEKNKKNNNNNKLVIPKEVEKVPVYIPYSERKNKVKSTGKLVIRK